MADIHEVLLTAELPAELPDTELAELRWHLGLGPHPERCVIVVDHWPVRTVDEEGEPLPEDRWEVERYPLLDARGAADPRIGGAVLSALVRRDGPGDPGWALTSRQVLHAEEFPLLEQLLRWLRQRATGHRGGPARLHCHIRSPEDGPVLRPVPLDGAGLDGLGSEGAGVEP
ncbi:hypothetical protein [Streptomyces sp. NPDC005438]|uniref:hypothetical protein n=1 Tax=Streptomyces sp. NPDC005438 TaxID=3156880 RepID=UPI0033A3F233